MVPTSAAMEISAVLQTAKASAKVKVAGVLHLLVTIKKTASTVALCAAVHSCRAASTQHVFWAINAHRRKLSCARTPLSVLTADFAAQNLVQTSLWAYAKPAAHKRASTRNALAIWLTARGCGQLSAHIAIRAIGIQRTTCLRGHHHRCSSEASGANHT